jgi:hypothetical protein
VPYPNEPPPGPLPPLPGDPPPVPGEPEPPRTRDAWADLRGGNDREERWPAGERLGTGAGGAGPGTDRGWQAESDDRYGGRPEDARGSWGTSGSADRSGGPPEWPQPQDRQGDLDGPARQPWEQDTGRPDGAAWQSDGRQQGSAARQGWEQGAGQQSGAARQGWEQGAGQQGGWRGDGVEAVGAAAAGPSPFRPLDAAAVRGERDDVGPTAWRHESGTAQAEPTTAQVARYAELNPMETTNSLTGAILGPRNLPPDTEAEARGQSRTRAVIVIMVVTVLVLILIGGGLALFAGHVFGGS